MRDGGRYATRTVQAKQKGQTIFTIICSFHDPEEHQMSHQQDYEEIKNVPLPENLPTQEDRLDRWLEKINTGMLEAKGDFFEFSIVI